MKAIGYLLSLLVLISLVSCKQQSFKVFSPEHPYSLVIKKERSYFQAEKINERLNQMNVASYVVYQVDTTDGEWYMILTGAKNNIDSVKSYQARMQVSLNLDSILIVNYNSLDSFKIVTPGDTTIIKETKNITANKPDVAESIFKVCAQYPQSNALYLDQITLIDLDSEQLKYSLFVSNDLKMDLPRGINLEKLSEKCVAFSEVQFKDNLYDDLVSMHVLKLKPIVNPVATASIINFENKKYFELAEQYADMILGTGEYLIEDKQEIEIPAATKMYGYKVSIEPKKDYLRTYYILVDETMSYLYFSQSTDKTDEELIEILKQIGNGKGLMDYDEYYNAFYTLPDHLPENDAFIGFALTKLGLRYAKDRNYAKWANKMVGHWDAIGFFNNPDKGIWNFNLFDVLTQEQQSYIYGTLYSSDSKEGKYKSVFYGVNGYSVYYEYDDWYTGKPLKYLREINFGYGRYIYALGNYIESEFNESDMALRAESMQFEKGGYKLAEKKVIQ